jgi:hypothetical protein
LAGQASTLLLLFIFEILKKYFSKKTHFPKGGKKASLLEY